MKTIDLSEKGLEELIVRELTRKAISDFQPVFGESKPTEFGVLKPYLSGDSKDYDRQHAVDRFMLFSFIQETQPETFSQLGLKDDGPRLNEFLARLQGEIAKRGAIDVLRKGIQHKAASVTLFYGTPSPGNVFAKNQFNANRFSVTRQLRYSQDETKLALDLCLFINGLPVITFELKNSLTKQTYDDAIQQYKTDRDPKELLFQFGRCVVHFAVDDQQVWMCTHLTGKDSWFLPFNKGYNDGAGNPPNPEGLMTDYLWEEILSPKGLTEIIENYAQVVEEKDTRTDRKRKKQIFPRYHQLDVVRKLISDVSRNGVGRHYLIQHSAGSGKSNSIAWLAYQLVGIQHSSKAIFDSIIVVTDRKVLDRQIRDTIKQFAQVASVVGHAEHSGDLRRFLESGKKVIITTVQKFPFILDEIGDQHRGRKFAIIIDEAHSSQGGRMTAEMHMALGESQEEAEETFEDIINRIMETRKMLPNASYFAFTATPKNKTLEIFGDPFQEGGATKHRPFHSYTMKQAIQEGFILDVLQNYTPVNSYYQLVKKIEDDPLFDTRKAQKKIRHYIEHHEYAIEQKAEIMVDHFHNNVIARQKVGGQARAMVVTSGVELAIKYFFAIRDYLKKRNSPWKVIVAFSGEREINDQKMTEATLNGFPSNQIPEKFREDPYRLLVAAEKFQTGYDEPLLHTMYVDKILDGIKAVQTLSRLNRAHRQKSDTFILDFVNDADTIQKAFEPYYRTTILSAETDPNKLHDLKADLDNYQVYSEEQVESLVMRFIKGADRAQLDPILDACVAVYKEHLDEDGQVDFKGKCKAFVRLYNFLATILPYSLAPWEKLSIFLNCLIPKLPAPIEQDLAKGILEAIDMDSYRAEVQATLNITLADEDGEIGPVPTIAEGGLLEPEMDKLSNILKAFNDQFGNIEWRDIDKISQVIRVDIPAMVKADQAYQNAQRNSDRETARIEHDKALQRVMLSLLADHTELFKQFSDNESFRKWLSESIFWLTYNPPKSTSGIA